MQPQKKQKVDQRPILFYSHTNPQFYFLSNFYPSPFKLEGNQYKTNQHYFQSQKFVGTAQQKQVIDAQDPKQAKRLGRVNKMHRPEQWPQIKQKVMLVGLRAKFEQNKQLLEKLLATGNRQLREHTGNDKYWGDGGNKNTGKNRLGILLMQVREQFRNKK